MPTNVEIEKWEFELSRVFTDKIVLDALGREWGKDLPPDMVPQIITERLARYAIYIQSISKETITEATDTEAAAYLYTASLAYPFDRDWVDIYTYLVSLFIATKGGQMPPELAPEKLTDYQEELLRDLKRKIRASQDRHFAKIRPQLRKERHAFQRIQEIGPAQVLDDLTEEVTTLQVEVAALLEEISE